MSKSWSGLSEVEAYRRIHEFGFNEIEEKRLTTVLQYLLKMFLDPMGLMLLVLAVLYWMLGEHHDAVILLVAYVPMIGIDVLLELRSQTSLRALKKTLSSTCTVIRDSKPISIPTRNLVPGDLLVLEEGQCIPADGLLIDGTNLSVDESSLTGESVPVGKCVRQVLLSGTTVLTGAGIVEIEKTGLFSQIGSIAKVLKEFEAATSPLLRSINKIVKIAFLFALAIAVIIFLEEVMRSQSVSASLISAVTLAMAAIPEEFPLVFTLYLSMAAYRLSKKGVLVKALPAVEGLGRVDIICTDKTGTLTEGKFQLEGILARKDCGKLDDSEVRALVFSCEDVATDAMETSIFEWVRKEKGLDFVERVHREWDLEYDNGFNTKEKYMSHVWKEVVSHRQVMAMKGSVEGVLEHCDISSADKADILSIANAEAEAGGRLLGLALKTGHFTGRRETDEKSLKFVCILRFADPIRPSVKDAIRVCIANDIKIKMLTGDHLLTAHSIADKINLPHEHNQLYTGAALEAMEPDERNLAFQNGVVFARLKPEQKFELVKSLKASDSIVAMTGDGINDAPALKLADVGISMGERATEVARSTAQLILLKNDFSGIVAAILEGRRVFASLRESFGYLIAFHIPIIGLALYQAFFLSSPILLPIHIVLMELIVHPVSAFVFDNSAADVGDRPRDLVDSRLVIWSALRGALLTGICLAITYLSDGTPEYRRSIAVLVLVSGNIGLLIAESGGIFSAIRDVSRFRRTWLAAGLLSLMVAGLGYLPVLTDLFNLIQPTTFQFLSILVVGFMVGAFTNPAESKISRNETAPAQPAGHAA